MNASSIEIHDVFSHPDLNTTHKILNRRRLANIRNEMSNAIVSEYLESDDTSKSNEYSSVILEFIKMTNLPLNEEIKTINGSLSCFLDKLDNHDQMSSSNQILQAKGLKSPFQVDLLLDDYIIKSDSICSKPHDSQESINFHHRQISSIIEESSWIQYVATSKNSRKPGNGLTLKNDSFAITQSEADKISATEQSLNHSKPKPYSTPNPYQKPHVTRKNEKPKRKSRPEPQEANNFMSLPVGSMSSKIEHIQYTEIQTPSFKLYQPGTIPTKLDKNFIEDLTDQSFMARHESFETDEHNRYLRSMLDGRKNNKRDSQNATNIAKNFKDGRKMDIYTLSNITLFDEDMAPF
ncbi:hypothetical protein RF11_11042 [Thelohanellus kitauei]|uniref:Uncharacterized protein n=1 Tax=Thelohanellus kitauei TaxID=669202 RepID=A0A0C2IVJ8_THEKT|nr:hypothetical protein RF11_11042 [Thelohanellus kitauei]